MTRIRLNRWTLHSGDSVASIFALAGLAVTQPMLSVLGGDPDFFFAHHASRWHVGMIGVGLAVLLPAALAGLIVAARTAAPVAGLATHAAIAALLGALLWVQVTSNAGLRGMSTTMAALSGLAFGALVAASWYRWQAVRRFLRFAAVAPFVSLAVFLLGSDAAQPASTGRSAASSDLPSPARPAPIVLVVFDEFSGASLMNESGDIDRGVFPRLAEFAEDATWYRNATASHWWTNRAVPSILTAVGPPANSPLPTIGNYPDNLFTLLAPTYSIHALEAVTRLCPTEACQEVGTSATAFRWNSMIDDLRIIAGHVLLPPALRDTLPAIDENPAHFGQVSAAPLPDDEFQRRSDEEIADVRAQELDVLLGAIRRLGSRSLLFAHTLLPHRPWDLLPSGQRYETVGAVPGTGPHLSWEHDEWLVAQAYQRYLLQAGYADAFVGRLLDRLEEEGLYDDALIVLTADHGISFRADAPFRRATKATLDEVAWVPMFVKLPGQTRGRIDDRRATTLDVLPTIADVIEIDIPWNHDGRSLIGEPARDASQIGHRDRIWFEVEDGIGPLIGAARRRWALFPDGPYSLAPAEGLRDLLGEDVRELPLGGSRYSVTLDQENRYQAIDMDAPVLPVLVAGSLHGAAEPTLLGVAINGRLEAIVRSFRRADGASRFQAMIPPRSLREGGNDIRIIEIRLTVEGPRLSPLQRRSD